MGLLDDLKQEANLIQMGERSSRSKAAQDLVFYEQYLEPAMLRAHEYLRDLLVQIDIVQPEIEGRFIIPGHGAIVALQTGRKVSINSLDQLTRINLRVDSAVEECNFSVIPMDRADETRLFLEQSMQSFSDWPIRDDNNQIIGLKFALHKFEISGSITIEADISSHIISVQTDNIQAYGHHHEILKAEQLTEDWLDKLGRLIIGEITAPGQLEISADAKLAIQAKIDQAKARALEEEEAMDETVRLETLESSKRVKAERLLKRVKLLVSTKVDKLIDKQ